MFYEGTLQSGIGQAIQQQKLVACFIRDDGATSKQWEDEWLRSGWLSSLLEQKAILLRLQRGSTEAGFLAAFCKIDSAPTLVVIHNGQLQLQLGSGVAQDEFVNAVRKVLGAAPIPGSAAALATTALAEDELDAGEEPAGGMAPAVGMAPARAPAPPVAPQGALRTATPGTATSTATPTSAKGKQRADSTPQAGLASSPSTTTSAQAAARAALQKKKREDAEELARVKARIEQDKAERRAQAEARKAAREQERSADAQSAASRTTTTPSTRGSQSPTVQLSIRLFDGRTIRSAFPRTATLSHDVRAWIDGALASTTTSSSSAPTTPPPPYFFRHILPPLPSRELSAGDETQPLGDIDLAPSAALVLVPVKGYADAYSGSGGSATNLFAGTTSGIVSGAFGLLSSTVGYAGGILGSFLGGGGGNEAAGNSRGQTVGGGGAAEQPGNSRSERDDQGAIRVRTLADQRAREPGTQQQFYNGNQSNVEPRPDDRG